MRNWDTSDEAGEEACTHDADWADVQTVCAQLQIPCQQVDFSRDYWHDVFSPSLDVFSQGFTVSKVNHLAIGCSVAQCSAVCSTSGDNVVFL
jgi:tRNA U34 2-thiouridine synthase MnmA/TrmU